MFTRVKQPSQAIILEFNPLFRFRQAPQKHFPDFSAVAYSKNHPKKAWFAENPLRPLLLGQ
jgi:hypothetical protein